MAKDHNQISQKEVPHYATKFKCKPAAVRLAKIIVGENAKEIQELIEELRLTAKVVEYVTVRIPKDLLFNDKDLEG